jgi:hypothetical protein
MTTDPKTPEPSEKRRPAAATPIRASELQVGLWSGFGLVAFPKEA